MSKVAITSELQYTKVPANETKNDIEKLETPATFGFGTRHIQLIIFFLCLVTSFISRGHLGVTLVAMTTNPDETSNAKESITFSPNNYTDSYYNETDVDYTEDIESYVLNETDNNVVGSNETIESNTTSESGSLYSTFHWPKSTQEMVLTSFFMGYCLGMLPVSLVCQRWGGKVPLQVAMFVNGLVSLITPTLAYWGDWQAVCVCRFLQGMTQAGTYPGIQTLLAQWVPDCEKGTLTSYVYTGSMVGSIIGFQIGGIASAAAGWPATFWTIGALCLLMFALLTVYGAASPRVHKMISEEERNFIIAQTGATSSRAPWKALLTTKPLLANYCTAVGSGVSFVFFFTQVPSYIHYIYGIDVQSSGVLTSLPYIVSVFASIVLGMVSDYLINHNIMSRKNTRRYSNLFSQTGAALALLGASCANSTTAAVICFVFYMVSHMGVHTGWMINQIDLSPNYSGTLMAISSCAINLVVIIMPFVISNVIIDMENVFQWRVMMYLEAAICLIPSIIFAIYISDEVQPWNDGNQPEGEIYDIKLKSIVKHQVEKKEVEIKLNP